MDRLTIPPRFAGYLAAHLILGSSTRLLEKTSCEPLPRRLHEVGDDVVESLDAHGHAQQRIDHWETPIQETDPRSDKPGGRKRIAQRVSAGNQSPVSQPRQGRKKSAETRCDEQQTGERLRRGSYAPGRGYVDSALVPWLTPWASFFRPPVSRSRMARALLRGLAHSAFIPTAHARTSLFRPPG